MIALHSAVHISIGCDACVLVSLAHCSWLLYCFVWATFYLSLLMIRCLALILSNISCCHWYSVLSLCTFCLNICFFCTSCMHEAPFCWHKSPCMNAWIHKLGRHFYTTSLRRAQQMRVKQENTTTMPLQPLHFYLISHLALFSPHRFGRLFLLLFASCLRHEYLRMEM